MLTSFYLSLLSFLPTPVTSHQSPITTPLATFSYAIGACGDTVAFTDLSGGISWQWSFPGGSPSSASVQNPVVVYASPGSYQVCLTAIIPGSVCQACDTIEIHCETQPPVLSGCPVDITVQGMPDPTGQCSAFVQIASPTVSDNCDPNPVLTNSFNGTSNASGSYPQGTTGVTWTATDACGNVSTCSFKVTVECQNDLAECGLAVVTCFSGFNSPTNYWSGVNQNAPVVALVDVRDHSTATPGTLWGVASASEYSDPTWTPQNLGQVFGIAIDSSQDIFVAASTIYTCSTTSPIAYNPFTAAGPGAVYRIDGSTGAVSNYVTTGAFTPGGTTIPNNGSALGDICYDALHDQFFVTNHADGMIYRIKNGLVLSRFDPFGTLNPPASGNGSDPSFVALGERTWGVGYFNGRVYFATWTEDIQRQNPTAANEIWSIGLDGAGEFQGTFFNGGSQKWEDGEVLEITLPCYPVSANYSNPVSDIAFSNSGRMLLAERTMSSDCGGAFSTNWYGYAHSSRVLEYEFTGTWTLTPGHVGTVCSSNLNKKFTTGAANGVTDNSAGGIDYGYASFNPATTTQPDCDRFIWNTGDNLHPSTGFNTFCSQPGTTWLYGMQGTPATGGTNLNGLLVDFDNNVCSHDKILIGDVEIFRCGCRSDTTTFPCDSLWVTKKPLEPDPTTPPDTCCWDIDFHIHAGPVAYLEVESLTPGVIFNNAALSSQFQWGGTPTNTLLPIAWGSPGHGIPQGDYNDALKFCLGNILMPQQDTQCVVFRWYVFGPTDIPEIACTDTCYFYCPPPVFGDTCLLVKNDSVACNPDKPLEYCYFFQVQNLTGFAANQVVLSNPTPGFAFKPCPPPNINITSPTIALPNPPLSPGIPPDSCSPTLCVKIVASQPVLTPTVFCFEAGLNSTYSCCHSPKKHCITLEPCCDPCEKRRVVSHTTNPDSCCHSLDISNDCGYDFFTKLELALLTPGVIFGSHYTGGPMPGDWFNPISTSTLVQWQHISGFVPHGTTAGLINFCLDGIDMPSEVPQVVVLNWITTSSTGKDSVACSDTLVFDCPAQNFGCIEVVEDSIFCVEDENGNIYYQYDLTFHNASNPPHFATELIFTQIGGPPVVVFPNPVNFYPPGANVCDTTTITTNFFPSGTLAPGTKLVFVVRLHDALHPDNWCCFEGDTLCIFIPPCGDECVCAPADLSLATGGAVFGISCTAGGQIPTLPCPAGDVTISGFFGCLSSTGVPCPETVVTWSLTGPNGVVSSGTTTNFPSLTFPASQVSAAGTYCLTLATLCPGSVDSCVCTVCWVQPECGGCCSDFEAFCNLVNQSFTVAVSGCDVVVTSPQFDTCHWFGMAPDWGDGTIGLPVVVPANGIWMHTYSQSGTYNICVNVFEQSAGGDACWTKQMCTTVTVQCPPACVCATPDLKLEAGGASFPLTCGGQGPALGCPASDVTISGTFGCVSNVPGTSCPDTQISWTLFGPGGFVTSGSGVTPLFSQNFPAAQVSLPGTYTLTLQTLCPGQTDSCICVVSWFQEDCFGCQCASFSKIKIQNKKTGLSQELACNNQPPVPIPCPPSGKPHKITGKLVCLGGCPGTTTWTVMNPLGATVLSGSSGGSPWFSIAIPSTAVTVNGLYMVKINGLCDNDTCSCKLNLLFDGCAPDCKCEPLAAFQAEVNKGFHLTSAAGCTKNFFPDGTLTECDQVTWTVKDQAGNVLATATTVGNAPWAFTFPASGKYMICMKVKRTQPDGTMCEHEICRPVQINCGLPTLVACQNPVMENPGFSIGADPGILGSGGASDGWTRRAGSPEIISQPTCGDAFAIKIEGNCLISDILDHAVTLEAGKPYRYRFCFDLDNDILIGTPAGGVVVGRISTEPQTTGACVGECEEIFRVSEEGATIFWAEAQGQFTPGLSGNLFLTLHVENDFVEDEFSSQSPALLDNICIEKDTVTAAGEPVRASAIRLFPNPATGEVTVIFEDDAAQAEGLEILDLWGRTVQKEDLEPGKWSQGFSLAGLPAGVYFVKFLKNGAPVWVEKIVKQ